ncbi:MAG: phage terminase small subunit P27 family [Proteobacteria bacterium]|nr:phage terminase small subunit P27 family [Pseudomonadota bacterium]
MANHKQSKARKALKGTLRPGESGNAGHRLIKPPQAPGTLSEGAKIEWKGLAKVLTDLEVLTLADLRTLELLCETLATATALENTIRAEGFTIQAASGTGQKSHPALKALETTRNAATRMLADFGLSPRSRAHVDKAPINRDEFEDEYSFLDVKGPRMIPR